MSWLTYILKWLKDLYTWRNIGYVFFLLSFTLVILELGARWYLTSVLEKSTKRKFQFNSYRIYSHVPGFTEGDEKGNWIEINDQGFRRSENVSMEKPANTYRVFLMGGSAAHGISSAAPYPVAHTYNDETIDAQLEQILQEEYPDRKIEIINAAVTGYYVSQHTSYILSELLNYDPDLFIFFDGVNDHYMYTAQQDYFQDNPYQYWAPRLIHPTTSGLFDYVSLWTSEFSALARGYYAWDLQHDANKNLFQFSDFVTHFSDREIIQSYLAIRKGRYYRSVETNLLILQHYNIDAIICLQPALILRDELLRTDTEQFLMQWVNQTEWPLLYPYVTADLDTIAHAFDVDYVDFIPLFNDEKMKGETLFIDYCHLSVAGNKEVANRMAPYVEKLLLRRHWPKEQLQIFNNQFDSISSP